MHKYFIAIGLLVAVACSQERNPEIVKNELSEAQTALDSASAKVSALEQELVSLTGSDQNKVTKVRVANIEPAYFEHIFETNANVEARNSAYISPEVGGQIKAIHVKSGDKVEKGTLMVTLNSLAQRSQLEELKSGLELAEVLYKKQKELWDQKIGSEVQYLQAKNSVESLKSKMKALEAQIAMTEVRAPFNGYVDEIYSKVGELAAPGQRLLDFVDMNQMLVKADISEAAIQHVKKGDEVEVLLPNFPAWSYKGTISMVGKIINTANRTFRVEIEIPNKDNFLKPNQIASVRLRDFHSNEALVVPTLVVKKDIKGDYVFVAQNQGGYTAAKKVYVKLAESFDGKTRIMEGLKAGDQVLVEGYNMVREGSAIEIAK